MRPVNLRNYVSYPRNNYPWANCDEINRRPLWLRETKSKIIPNTKKKQNKTIECLIEVSDFHKIC